MEERQKHFESELEREKEAVRQDLTRQHVQNTQQLHD